MALSGFIDERCCAALLLRFEELRFLGSQPITVYINSSGGEPTSVEQIFNHLHSKDINGVSCVSITVALGEACSAAGIALTLGFYSYAYPHSEIHLHGIRFEERRDVDSEMAYTIVDSLELRTRALSNAMAERVIKRLIHRYSILLPQFAEIRRMRPYLTIHDLECFERSIKPEISKPIAEKLVGPTVKRTLKALAL